MGVDPASLQIVHYPAKVLRARAKPLESVTAEVRSVAKRMIELMHQAEGIGLAAPQVGLSWRLFVCMVEPNEERPLGADPVQAVTEPMVCINPKLSKPERDLVPYEEGCLSLPDIRGDVRRPSAITMTALGLDGKEFTLRGAGLLARCWQHEIDHLDGVLIIDKMAEAHRKRNKAAIQELEAGGELHVAPKPKARAL